MIRSAGKHAANRASPTTLATLASLQVVLRRPAFSGSALRERNWRYLRIPELRVQEGRQCADGMVNCSDGLEPKETPSRAKQDVDAAGSGLGSPDMS